ncbi:MAG: protein kinase, partial [Maioricimonas sp. JB049]
MTTTSICPSCGSDLPADSPDGLCPDCLLSAGLEGGDSREAVRPRDVTTPMPGLFVPPTPESLAAHFPQLEILQSLGHGGMGAVYKARQTKLDRMVALKILRPESADDPAFAERFNREARTLARMHHPHVVAIHDFGEVNLSATGDEGGNSRRVYYFVMEYVDGASLRDLILEGNLKPDQCYTIVAQICEALQYAHDEHVIHRDIKPENILVDSRGRVKIADFGLAKLAARARDDFTLTGTHQVMGTPRYMAPEQMEGSHLVDHRADIYSLGVVFYEMLTGQVPAGHFEPPSGKVKVDARIDQIVLRAMARDPHRRYQNVSELKGDVGTVAGSSVMNSYDQVAPAVAQVADGPLGQYMSDYDQEMLRLDARAPAGGLMLVGALGAAFWSAMGLWFLTEFRSDSGETIAGVGGAAAAICAGMFLIYAGMR